MFCPSQANALTVGAYLPSGETVGEEESHTQPEAQGTVWIWLLTAITTLSMAFNHCLRFHVCVMAIITDLLPTSICFCEKYISDALSTKGF